MSAANTSSSQGGDTDRRRDDRAGPLALLRRIGEDLDQHKTLVVYRGGTVMPSTGRPSPNTLGEEVSREPSRLTSGTERPAARQGQGSAAGDPAEARPGRSAASVLRESGVASGIVADIEDATDAQKEGYDQLRVRLGRYGIIWLEGEVWPIQDADFGARIRVAYPVDERLPLRAWAWWTDTLYWIGPRHTNFGDGSICAYELPDATWTRGKPLVSYLDLVAVWLARHAYLRLTGRWPGRQALHTAQERLTEHRPGEICGGCESGRPYERCHRPRDARVSPQQVEHEYRVRYQNQVQLPPADDAGFERAALIPWPAIA